MNIKFLNTNFMNYFMVLVKNNDIKVESWAKIVE